MSNPLLLYLIDSKVETTINTKQFQTIHSPQEQSQTRLILFLLDGARPDYLFSNKSYGEWQPLFPSLIQNNPNHTVCTTMHVDPPTSTIQGVKTLLTGGMRSFIELGESFFSSVLQSDHWILQLRKHRNLTIAHVGDPLWRDLAGEDAFVNPISTIDSYNVYEDDSQSIQSTLESFLQVGGDLYQTDVLIVHSLLVDHNAHRTSSSSPSNPSIRDSLLQFNRHLQYTISHLPSNTLLLIFGDHGLSQFGNHGGASEDEITTGLCAISSSYELQPFPVGYDIQAVVWCSSLAYSSYSRFSSDHFLLLFISGSFHKYWICII